MALHRFIDWPLRAKMAALLVVATLLPLGLATWVNIAEARQRLLDNTTAVLAARSDQLAGRVDAFNMGYQRGVNRIAHLPAVLQVFAAMPADRGRIEAELAAQLAVWPASDASIRGVALIDLSGNVTFATEQSLIGVNVRYRSFVQEALRGVAVVSDIFVSSPLVETVPTMAFLEPVRGSNGQLLGVAALWIHATDLWNVMKESNALAGPGSFAVLFDQLGIRIGHTYSDEITFHPAGPLAPSTVDALVAEQRFGSDTRSLLEDIRPFPEQFERARADSPDLGLFQGFAPVNLQWNYGVARRFETVKWTVFYMVPVAAMQGQVALMMQQKLIFFGVILLLATVSGALFAAVVLQPIRQLSAGARLLASGDLEARIQIRQKDELGELGGTFNSMATRIQSQAAELQQESEKQYRLLFESLTEGFCIVEVIFDDHGKPLDCRFLEVNAAFAGHTGISNATGRSMREITPDVESDLFEIYGQVVLSGEPAQFENEVKPLGRFFHVRAYRFGGSGSHKVAVVFSDITEQRDMDLYRQAQLERVNLLQQITRAIGERQDLPNIFQVVLRSLEDHLSIDFCCICLYEREPNQLLVTRVGPRSTELAVAMALTEQSRFSVDENGLSRCVRGQLVYEPDVREIPFAFPQRLLAGGLHALVAAPLLVESRVFGVLIAARRVASSFSSGECEFLRQLSEHVALAAHHAQLYSSLQAAYEELRQTQQTAIQQERLRALGQMASGIAHDINNAISPVALYTDSLLEREKSISEPGRAQLHTIQRAIHDVSVTVSRMRDFYRQPESQVAPVPVQLNDLVPQVVEHTRARWNDMPQKRGIVIEIRTQLAPSLPTIMAVESDLREALTNLVFNAVDAMPQGGTLSLQTRVTAAGRVRVEVGDTGVGMDEVARRRCLEPFFTTKGERGTGLGLAMVYGTVQRHGAQIEIDSTVGSGTRFCIDFDAATEAVPPAQPATVSVSVPLHILIIDDDPVLLRALCITLMSDGHSIVSAIGGKEGIEHFRSSLGKARFDVVITDLGMPHVDGRRVASALKAMSPATPVILLTGWGQRLLAEGDVPEHVDIVLSKPPKLRELREALARCVQIAGKAN